MANLSKYDVVIVGGGLGGLLCGVLLAKNGKKVCILEKNKQAGGCLQSFAVHKKLFDSCIHYIGGLGEGHTLNRIFKYAGIMQHLKLKPYDNNGVDRIAFGSAEEEYPHAVGEENFIKQLLPYFPDEKSALLNYLTLVKDTTARFPMYHLQNTDAAGKAALASMELSAVINSLTENPLLREVLMGNNLLYAGVRGKTPFYLHALVMESYLHSAHKVVPGSGEITKYLVREFRKYGGIVHRKSPVVKIEDEQGLLTCAITAAGDRFFADTFVAAIHPALLEKILDHRLMRPAFHQRIGGLEQTQSAFMVNLVLKPQTVKFKPHNLYWHRNLDALAAIDGKNWPATYALYFSEDEANPGFADRISILTYMDAKATSNWERSLNHTAQPATRGQAYEAFKENYARLLVTTVEERLPKLSANVVAQSVATPLTFRDYTGNPYGSLYGILKDVGAEGRTTINTRTRINNLFLTGQNVNLHGVLGVSITSVLTAGEIIGLDILLEKIKSVNYL